MSTAPQVHEMTTTEGAANGRNISVDCKGKLDSGELLTGTVTIPAVSGITFSNEAVNTSILTINDRSVAIGEAIQFNVKGTTTGTYTISGSAATDATPAQTIEFSAILIIK